MSPNTISTFVLLISWLPRGLDITSWTVLNSPYPVDFKNVQFFFTILWNMGQGIGKILHFCFLYEAVHSWALMSIHECWYAPMGQWRHAHDYSWGLMSAHTHCSMAPSLWLFISAANEQTLALTNTNKQPGAAMNTHELGTMEQWALMRAQEQSWAWCHEAMSTHKHSWALMAP